MNLDIEFINCVMCNESYSDLRNSGIFEHMIRDELAKRAYQFIQEYYSEYKQMPTKQILLRETMFSVSSPQAGLKYIADEIKRRESHDKIVSILQEAGQILAEKDYKKMIEKWDDISKRVSEHLPTQEKVRHLIDCAKEAEIKYDKAKNKEYGLLTPYQSLNKLTLGWKGGDYALFGGRSGIGKSFLTLFMLSELYNKNHRVLYISPEMAINSLLERFAAISLGISYNKIREGSLPPLAESKYKAFLKSRDEKMLNIFAMSDDFNFDIKEIVREVERCRPEIVFIDGIYLIKAKGFKNRFDQAAFIADEVKRMAKSFNIPFICTTQLNREAINLKVSELNQGHFVLSDAFAWSADYCFCIGKDKEHESKKLLAIKTVKSRESFMDRMILLHWNFETNRFDEISEDEYASYEKAKLVKTETSKSQSIKPDAKMKAIEVKSRSMFNEDDNEVF